MRAVLVVVALGACGRSTGIRQDASAVDGMGAPDAALDTTEDAAMDAPAPDAAVPDVLVQVRITVEIDGQPRPGERILINRRDGSLVGEDVTSANGVLDVDMPDGGSLTWVRADLALNRYYTYADLHDGYVVNTGTPAPPAIGTTTPISITRTNIPGAETERFGVDRFPDQAFVGATFTYPTTSSGTVAVIQDGRASLLEGDTEFDRSVGYSSTTVAVSAGASVTMPSTIHLPLDLVVDVVAPVLSGGNISATVVPFRTASASTSYAEAADSSGAVSIRFPRFVYSEVAYDSPLTVYFETVGQPLYEHHYTNYMINSSTTHVSLGLADLAECPRAVTFGGTSITIGQPPGRGDFARYGIGRWLIMAPVTTSSLARIVVPADLASEFAGTQPPLLVGSVDSGDIDYQEALSLQRSTHYSQFGLPLYPYTGDGHPFMRDCWRFQ